MANVGLDSGYCATIGSMGDKELKKKLRNRQSAQRARDRQKARMKWLEREVAIVTLKNQTLQQENTALKIMLENQMSSEVSTPKIPNTEEINKIKIQTEDKENVSEDESVVAEDLSVKTTNICFDDVVPSKENHFPHLISSVRKFDNDTMICQRQEKEFSPRHPSTVLPSSPDRVLPIPNLSNYRSHISDRNHQYLPLPNNVTCSQMSPPEEKLRHEKAAFLSPFFVGQMFPSYIPTAYGIVPFFAPGRENHANLCNPKRPANDVGFWDSGFSMSKRLKVHSYESESSGSSVLSSDENHSM